MVQLISEPGVQEGPSGSREISESWLNVSCQPDVISRAAHAREGSVNNLRIATTFTYPPNLNFLTRTLAILFVASNMSSGLMDTAPGGEGDQYYFPESVTVNTELTAPS